MKKNLTSGNSRTSTHGQVEDRGIGFLCRVGSKIRCRAGLPIKSVSLCLSVAGQLIACGSLEHCIRSIYLFLLNQGK